MEYNSNKYRIRLDTIEDWQRGGNLAPQEKDVLKAMLFNNEWPIDVNTILSKKLIAQILRLGDYPRNFIEKLNYYLLKCYLNGGNEYKPVDFDIQKYQDSYAVDEDEFGRIINGLHSKEYISLADGINIHSKNFDFQLTLTELGVKFSENLVRINELKQPVKYTRAKKPTIAIVHAKKDQFYAEELKEFLSSTGISVSFNSGIDDEHGLSEVENSRSTLYSEEIDYIIFVKSENSDKNNSMGSIIDIAIEAHANTRKRNFNYLYFAFVDDSTSSTRPRIDTYHHTFYDFRIITNRKLLLLDIHKDWLRRYPELAQRNAKYNFPLITLSQHEEAWLKVVYQKFLNNEKFEIRFLLSKMWDQIPKEFEPQNISPSLIRFGNQITLLGIWAIDSNSNIFENFDKVVYAVREILKNNNEVRDVSTNDIRQTHPELTFEDIFRVFRLLSGLSDFTNGIGGNDETKIYSIGVSTEEIYRRYRNYKGIEDIVYQLYKEHPSYSENLGENASIEPELLNKVIDLKSVHSHKTKIDYRDAHVKAVMGVAELSSDLAELIDNLPIQKEKGQMIGIFGKWGRGKTFLLKELWNILEKKKVGNNSVYTKIEYHAWKYQETPASWAYLYENFVKEYLGSKKGFKCYLKYHKRLLDLNVERLGIWPIIKFLLVVLAAIAAPVVTGWFLEWYYSLALIPIILASFLTILKQIYKEFSIKASDLIKLYNIRHSFKEEMGIQADIQDELIKLLKVWIKDAELGKRKILLVVEDIDRCSEDKIIQNIDALRVMLEDEEIYKRVIIVTAIDERILKNAIRLKYDSITEYNESELGSAAATVVTIHELVSEYLDKLFISAIKLGGLTIEQRDEYVNELLEQEVDAKVLSEYYESKKLENKKEDYRTSGMSPAITEMLFSDPSYLQGQEMIKNQETLMSQFSDQKFDMTIENGDFVEKDGDIGLQRSNGEVTSVTVIENTVNDRLKNQDKFEKLSPIEVDLIRQLVNQWESATPRRIRIYYYRYLLSKNILINKYTTLKRVNPWQNDKGINAMMSLILTYTKTHNPELISNEKVRVLLLNDDKVPVTTNSITIYPYRKDYIFLLEALELIIAY
ncbi:MAG: P-loop NTPase fold protein [Bacteroidota bacterium]